MKKGMKDRTVSKIVRTLQAISVLIGILLSVMACIMLSLNIISCPIFYIDIKCKRC